MAITQPAQTYIDETSDPGLPMTKIAIAKQDGGIVVFETPKDIYVTAVEERVTYQQVNNIVNAPSGNLTGEVQFGDNGSFGADKDFRYDPITDILSLGGGVITGDIVVARRANLGPATNVKITGGSTGQFLSTDGTGNLSWQTFVPPPVTLLPLSNGTSEFNIPAVNGQVTITANGDKMWVFDVNGQMTLPNANLGVGLNEQSKITSQRRIVPGGRCSATVSSPNTPTVVYAVSSAGIVAFKTILTVQHSNGLLEFVEIFASRSGADVSYTITNRVAPSALPASDIFVDLNLSGKLQITLTTTSASAWITYDAAEFGVPTA